MRTAPGPRGVALCRALLGLARDPLSEFRRATEEFGSVVHFSFGSRSFHLIAHPSDIAHVLHGNQRNYRKDTRTYAKIRDILGDGLVTSDGDTWQRQRALVQPAFHHEQISLFASTVVELTRDVLAGWRRHAVDGGTVDIGAEMTRLTLNIVARALFGVRAEVATGSTNAAITCALSHTAARAEGFFDFGNLPTPGGRRFRRALAQLDRLVGELIDERRRVPPERTDLLSLLLRARDEESGEGLGDAELRDQVLTLLLAGHETTATVLTWTSHLLARNPAVQDRLRAQIEATLNHEAPTYRCLTRLPYLRMVVQESMRLYPPFWLIERAAVQDDVLGGYAIAAGSTIALSQYVTHRHPSFWRDPDTFDPDRFLPEHVASRPRFAYFPFGGGARSCVGAGFAMMEAQLVLAMLIQQYRLIPVSAEQVRPAAGITLRPHAAVLMRMEAVA